MAMIASGAHERVIRHAHLFCGIGAGAKGFNQANPRVGKLTGRYVCAGGIDSDAGAIRNFERMTGGPGTVLDLFDREQYAAYHGHMPPPGWREATSLDIIMAFGDTPDVLFLSAPCKGFSGLLSTTKSKTDKYQALNRLTVRGMWLTLEAYKGDPVPIILFENVPRIANRGRHLLEQIISLLRHYGYIVNEDVHDCGEIGNLAQTRKRFLLIARHPDKVPPFVYQPTRHPLRGVGEVIGKLPLPGDPVGGIMHRVPMLQWQTWVRLAFVEAGKDWRSLNNLRVENGVLKDYGLVPDVELRDNALGVLRWGEDYSPVIIGNQRSPYQGRVSVADPRIESTLEGAGPLGVNRWEDAAGVIASQNRIYNGAFSVADPRPSYSLNVHRHVLGVKGWDDAAGVISASPKPSSGPNAVADPRPLGASWHDDVLGVHGWGDNARTLSGRTLPGNGAFSVADVRIDGHAKSVQLGVRPWGMAAPCLKGDMSVGGGPYAIADIRILGRPRFNNTFRVVRMDATAPAVAGPGGPGGQAVADPRPPASGYDSRKYRVHKMGDATRAVIGASTTGDGAFAVADDRPARASRDMHGKYRVEMWMGPSKAVIGGRDQGAFAVADPRCNWGNRHEAILRVTKGGEPVGTIPANAHSVTGGHPCVADERREHYQTSGHYGVVPWDGFSLTVSASIGHDNGYGSLADPRPCDLPDDAPIMLPVATQKLVCRIIAIDGTWHRPFTTLELASLQSLFDPELVFYEDQDGVWRMREEFILEGQSDAMRREWIGNAVPSAAAQGMAETIGETLLLAWAGEGFQLSTREIWVKPGALALAVDSRQPAFLMDGGLI